MSTDPAPATAARPDEPCEDCSHLLLASHDDTGCQECSCGMRVVSFVPVKESDDIAW